MNQTWKELPSPDVTQASEIAGISVVTEEGGKCSYQVIVHDASETKTRQIAHPRITRITTYHLGTSFRLYSSVTNTWTKSTVANKWSPPDADLSTHKLCRKLLYSRLTRNGGACAGTSTQITLPSEEDSSPPFRFMFAGEDSEGIWLVAEPKQYVGCEIWRLDGTGNGWETVGILPDDLEARMLSLRGAEAQPEELESHLQGPRDAFIYQIEGYPDADEQPLVDLPQENDFVFLEAADLAGDIIVVQMVLGRLRGPYSRYFLAYHTVRDSWKVLSSDFGCTECVKHQLFQAVPSLDVT